MRDINPEELVRVLNKGNDRTYFLNSKPSKNDVLINYFSTAPTPYSVKKSDFEEWNSKFDICLSKYLSLYATPKGKTSKSITVEEAETKKLKRQFKQLPQELRKKLTNNEILDGDLDRAVNSRGIYGV